MICNRISSRGIGTAAYNRDRAGKGLSKRLTALSILTKRENCYTIPITVITKDGEYMILRIDFNSDEALYMQLRNQIIIGIATGRIREGDTLPSVRQLAEHISINMHTVNKAYSVLRQEGFVKLDRRKGAVISLDLDKQRMLEEMKQEIAVVMAKGICKGVQREEVHSLVDEIYDLFANWEEG